MQQLNLHMLNVTSSRTCAKLTWRFRIANMASHNIDSRYDVTDTRGPEPHTHLINPYIRGAAEAVRIKEWIEIKQQPSSLNAATGKHSEGLLMASPHLAV